MKENNLSYKEILFCGYAVMFKNPIEAAKKAGYKSKTIWARLMADERIQKEINRRLEKESERNMRAEAMWGLWRVAFGENSDALRLILKGANISIEEACSLDLFSVSEIRKQKGGGLDIQFYDRVDAMEKLLKYCGDNAGDEGSLYSALMSSAVKIGDAGFLKENTHEV